MCAAPGPEVVAIDRDGTHAVEVAAEVLLAGASVVLPTDTVYGLAALPHIAGSTEALFALKGRSASQPMAVLVADVDQALGLVEAPSPTVAGWMHELWPGPLTLVLRRSPSARALILGGDHDDTIGLRCPAHPFLRALAARVGPVATTSANRSGSPTPRSALEAAASLVGPVGLVVDGGLAGTVPSTVVDASVDPWRILRVGALPESCLRDSDPADPDGA